MTATLRLKQARLQELLKRAEDEVKESEYRLMSAIGALNQVQFELIIQLLLQRQIRLHLLPCTVEVDLPEWGKVICILEDVVRWTDYKEYNCMIVIRHYGSKGQPLKHTEQWDWEYVKTMKRANPPGRKKS